MSQLLFGLTSFLLFPAIFALVFVLRRRREVELQRTAAALGLRVEPRQWWGRGGRLTGTLHGVPVRREPYVVSTGKTTQHFTRFIASGVPREVVVKREGIGQRVLKVFGSEDQLVGDPPFDDRFVVKGDPLWVSASLGDEARAALSLAGAGSSTVWVEKGEVVVQVAGDLTELSVVQARLESVARVAKAMRVDDGAVVARLTTVAREDSAPGARARAMALLTEVDAAAAEPVLRAALRDPEVILRIRAAALLRDPATTRVVLADPRVPDLARAELLGSLGDPAVAGELAGFLGHTDEDVRAAAVAALATVGGRDEVAPLRALAEREGWGEASRRAEAAIAAIQSRLGAVDAGRLALADGAGPLEGAVSEAGPVGAVSVAPVVRKAERAGGG